MNSKGLNIFGIMAMGFFAFLILPTILFLVWDISKIMFQIIMAFLIISYIKQFQIEGPLMWILSGILIYFLVYKYPYITATGYWLILMIGFGFTSVIIWGSSSLHGFMNARSQK